MRAMVNRGFFYGYDFHGTQPCLRLTLTLVPEAIDPARVDAWIRDAFRFDLQALAADDSDADEGDAPIRAAVDRALLVYGELARIANIPIFDRGRLIDMKPAPDQAGALAVRIALPVADNLQNKVFVDLFTEALRIVRTCSATPPGSDASGGILARMGKVIAALARSCPFHETTVPICRLAHSQGIPFRHMGSGYIRMGMGSEGRFLHHGTVQQDSLVGAAVSRDKRATARILKAAGLPGAEHVAVDSPDGARAAARQLGWPVVVKPADRDRSIGVTVGISDDAALLAAYAKARESSINILVERQVAGTCHRIFVAAGAVLYVVNRVPKRVKGNGRDSVAALVDVANARWDGLPPWKPSIPHVLDALALECLAADGFTPESVPAEGQFAYLRPFPTPEWGGEVEDLAGDIHPENAELAIAAARLLGLTMAGVDLITPDITQPWHTNGAIINEMNFRPQFGVEDREVAAPVLVKALVRDTGRIPVHLVTGSGNLEAAAGRLRQRLPGFHSASASSTLAPDGSELPVVEATLFERSLMLTMRHDVDGIILIGQPEELFARGLAVDRLDSMLVVDRDAERGADLLRQLQARFPAESASVSAK